MEHGHAIPQMEGLFLLVSDEDGGDAHAVDGPSQLAAGALAQPGNRGEQAAGIGMARVVIAGSSQLNRLVATPSSMTARQFLWVAYTAIDSPMKMRLIIRIRTTKTLPSQFIVSIP